MPFPGAVKSRLQASTPILVTSAPSVVVPSNAKTMYAYIIGGGGSGKVELGNIGGTCDGPGGGCGGATFIEVDLDKWKWEAGIASEDEILVIGFTIGSGGSVVTRTTAGLSNGLTGGTTTLTLTGGLSVSVLGGGGGGVAGFTSGGSGGLLATANRFTVTYGALAGSAVALRPLIPQPVGYASSTFSGDVVAAGGGTTSTVGSEVGNSGGTISGITLPWWMRRVGISTFGAGGSGASITSSGKAAGGGAGGFGGNGGNGAVLNAAGTVTGGTGAGYGSGGGGACGITGSTVTSGAGAPGCAVIVFELEV